MNYSYMSITIQFGMQHSRNRLFQVCTTHRDVRQFSTPWQVNICMLIRLRNSCRGRKRRKEHGGTIDGGWKTHSHDVTKGDARQSRESKHHHGQGDEMRGREMRKEQEGKRGGGKRCRGVRGKWITSLWIIICPTRGVLSVWLLIVMT